MRIAMIGHKRVPSREGGVEVVVEELATRMVQQSHMVEVYNRYGKHVADKTASINPKIKEYKGIKILTVPTINKKGIDAMLYSVFASIRALFGKYDVIHYHAEGSCAMLFIPHLFGIKTVATIHGLDWQRAKWGGFATWYLKRGEKTAVKYADHIIVLSENMQKYFLETYQRETICISNGVTCPEIKDASIITEKYGLHKDEYFLFLARIVPEKGLHYLIDAYEKMDTNKKLVIAGGMSHSGDYLEKIKIKVKNNNKIIMTGFVQGEELGELFSNCFRYVLPSDIEGMPLSLLEAMSYGCKCIVSDIDENVEVVEDKAKIFKKGNVDSLLEALNMSLDEKQLSSEKETIKTFILQKYNWDDVTKKTLDVYQS